VVEAGAEALHADAGAVLAGVRRAGIAVDARRAVRLEGVGRAVVAYAVTRLRHVALAGGGAAERRELGVCRAGEDRAVPGLGNVTHAAGGGGDDEGPRHAVSRTVGVRAVAGLGEVARAGGRPALGAGVAGRMRAGVADAVTDVVGAHAAVGGTCRAVRLLRV